MIIGLADVLTAEELNRVRAGLDAAEFIDGSLTAGWHARLVKHNRQADSRSELVRKLQQIVLGALGRSVAFQLAARPKALRPVLFNRYEPGMDYGAHVDDPIMSGATPLRSDVALTLFLSDPSSYEGGALAIESTSGEQRFKLEAGSMVVYPASFLHRVEPVERGVRLAAVTWVQSQVRDPACRQILYDLDAARRTLFEREGKSREFDLLSKSVANLLRMWSEV